MPVILRRDQYELWLDPTVEDKDELTALLTDESGRYLELYPVSRRVNSPANEGPQNIEPVETAT